MRRATASARSLAIRELGITPRGVRASLQSRWTSSDQRDQVIS